MTSTELLAKIKAEIERRIKIQDDWAGRKVLPGRDLAFAVKEELKQILSFLSTLEPEKPMNQDELEREISKKYANDTTTMRTREQYAELARYFYDLGCRRTAEKYDEIEYNRQKAEEQGSKGLEEEIIKCWQEWISPSNKQSVEGVLPLSEFAFYARHFAKWGAEHLKV